MTNQLINARTASDTDPDLSIIIVNWNCGRLLRRCVETVIASEPLVSYEILIVDNASSDDSLQELLTSAVVAPLHENQRLRVIRNSDNVGFGSANNQAFALTRAPLLFLLNPDTEISRGSIDTLVSTLLAQPDTGACGPKILNVDGSVQVSVWHNPPRAWQIVLSQLKLYLIFPRRLRGKLLLGGHWDHGYRRTVPMLSGAAILARREMIEQVGGFDEHFQMYAEDNEWCLRIIRAGWQLMFEPRSVILHYGGQSAIKRWSNLEKLRVQLEASFLFQQRALPRRNVIANQLANYLTISVQKAWRQVRGIKTPELDVIKQVHRQHLRQSLKTQSVDSHVQPAKASAGANNPV